MADKKEVVKGFCMKCKQKRKMVETEEVTMKNGRPALKGKCKFCGTKMFKILSIKKD